jgi:hypothetical protein
LTGFDVKWVVGIMAADIAMDFLPTTKVCYFRGVANDAGSWMLLGAVSVLPRHISELLELLLLSGVSPLWENR